MKLAPIVIFTYNRPRHTRQTVEALLKNEYAAASDLIIYSDAAKNEAAIAGVEQTRQYIHSIKGFKSLRIVERKENIGLANNIIDGVTAVVNEFGRIIVLEDDLLTSPYFLKFTNEALNLYEEVEEVISINGYMYPTSKQLPDSFFVKGADCLGWSTWKRGWDLFNPNGKELLTELEEKGLTKQFDFDGTYKYTRMLRRQSQGLLGSWAIRWYASAFLKNKLTLYPGQSLIFHDGSDGSGTNCADDDMFKVELSDRPLIVVFSKDLKESERGRNAIKHFFRYTMVVRKIKARLKRIVK